MSGPGNVIVLRGGERLGSLPADDRGLAYGDGVFETMRIHDGDLPWWPAHWARLSLGAEQLRIPLPDEGFVRDQARHLTASCEQGVFKMILTRGSGGRGYAPPEMPEPTVLLSQHPLPPAPSGTGLAVRWCDLRLSAQPRLAGIKHCNRLEQVLARAEWCDPAIDEGLLRDAEGALVCATAGNVFVRIEGRWCTPALATSGVAGLLRHWLLQQPGVCEVAGLSVNAVENAEALFLCNAVRGILPVSRLGERRWPPSSAISAMQQALVAYAPMFADSGKE